MTQAQLDVKKLASSLIKELTQTLTEVTPKIGRDDADAALARGKVFQIALYYVEAIESFQCALALNPRLDEAKARLAVVQARAFHVENALATAMDLAQTNPGYEFKELTSDLTMSAMTLLGDILVKNDRVVDAIEAYKVAATRYKNDAFAAGRLAQAYLVTGEPQLAIKELANIAANPRFRPVERLLSLGRDAAALLPRFAPDAMQALVAVSEHGRPMVVGDTMYVAPLVADTSDWCTGEA